ncbi:MAG: YdiY family protein [Erythrobacteraceae bacterium]|jgi:putative salt-induced outer membrane protein
MIRMHPSLILLAALSSPAAAQDLPPAIVDLLREATPQERATIENVAKRLFPAQRPEIDQAVDRIEDDEKTAVGEAQFVDGWSGESSLGASYSSGNNNEWSVSATINMERKGPRWEHDVAIDGLIRNNQGVRTEERLNTSYRGRRDFTGSPWFSFGTLQFEHDLRVGIDTRFTETLGVGFQLINRDALKWEASAGPALRQTKFEDGFSESTLAAFVGTELKWEITDTLTFREKMGAVMDNSNSSFSSVTSLTTNVYGRLSGRMSFELNAETDPSTGNDELDTRTLLSLVLGL